MFTNAVQNWVGSPPVSVVTVVAFGRAGAGSAGGRVLGGGVVVVVGGSVVGVVSGVPRARLAQRRRHIPHGRRDLAPHREVDGHHVGHPAPLGGALLEPALQQLRVVGLGRLAGIGRRGVDPVVHQEEGGVGRAPVGSAAEVRRRLEVVAGLLEPVVRLLVPGRRAGPALLGEDEEGLVLVDHLAQRRQGLAWFERVGVVGQTRLGDGRRRVGRRGGVLDDEADHVVGMGVDEVLHVAQHAGERHRTHLAVVVAEVDLPRRAGLGRRPGRQLAGPLGDGGVVVLPCRLTTARRLGRSARPGPSCRPSSTPTARRSGCRSGGPAHRRRADP